MSGRTAILVRPILVAGLCALLAHPASAAPSAYDAAFVSAFAEACVPERLSFAGTKRTAEALGWREVERTAHPELEAMLGVMDRGLEAEADLLVGFELSLYSKPIAAGEHYLLVARTSADVGTDAPDLWNTISCYLYNFDAAAPIDPEPVSALLGQPVARSHSDPSMVAYSWGPSCAMPRTLDTYMTWVPEGSEHAAAAGFSGLVLKFETSEPAPGEAVPSTYC